MQMQPIAAADPEAVWSALTEHVRPLRARESALAQSFGLVLAGDARADGDYPPFDRAVMDGFGVRLIDVQSAPCTLAIHALVRAGADAPGPLPASSCVQINTGSVIPPGVEAIVPVERARGGADGSVELLESPKPGQHIERAGAHVRRGDLLVRAGVTIDAGALASLAAGGVRELRVYTRPQVALLATGDEVVDASGEIGPGQIADSNSVALEQVLRESGGEPVLFGRCCDEEAALRASLELGLSHDMLCVVGGMSKGTHDLVPRLLEELGVRWIVTSLNLKPGKPMRIGRTLSGGWVLGLPGNPVSCLVCFYLFGRPLLDGLRGAGVRSPVHLRGTLANDLPPNGDRPMFHPAEWSAAPDGSSLLSPIAWRGSGDPFGMTAANALIRRAAGAPGATRGERVQFVPIGPIQ